MARQPACRRQICNRGMDTSYDSMLMVKKIIDMINKTVKMAQGIGKIPQIVIAISAYCAIIVATGSHTVSSSPYGRKGFPSFAGAAPATYRDAVTSIDPPGLALETSG